MEPDEQKQIEDLKANIRKQKTLEELASAREARAKRTRKALAQKHGQNHQERATENPVARLAVESLHWVLTLLYLGSIMLGTAVGWSRDGSLGAVFGFFGALFAGALIYGVPFLARHGVRS